MSESSVILIVGTMCMDVDKVLEFNDWYNNIHINEVCNLPGVKRGTRFEIIECEEYYPNYITLYEMKGEQGYREFNEFLKKQKMKGSNLFTPGPPAKVIWNKAYRRISP